jgi:hypothetical protein
VTEAEIVHLGIPFGRVTNVLVLKGKNQVRGVRDAFFFVFFFPFFRVVEVVCLWTTRHGDHHHYFTRASFFFV